MLSYESLLPVSREVLYQLFDGLETLTLIFIEKKKKMCKLLIALIAEGLQP